MQFELATAKNAGAKTYHSLFGGRIARTSFVIRVAIIVGSVWIVSAPLSSFLSTSSKTLKDAYLALSLVFLAVCALGLASAYIKRLHDIGLRGFWAVLFVLALPCLVIEAAEIYTNYRYLQDESADAYSILGIIVPLVFAMPLLIAMWRGEKGENRFGPAPVLVEHVGASKFNIAAVLGAAAIVIPTSIYAGLFQPAVWVGRGDSAPSMPMIDSNSSGRLLAKCWNIKGVSAGTGGGSLGGVNRDGYGGSVFDFVVSDDGQIDIVPAGETFAKAYRADGFRIDSYGLDESGGYISVGEKDRFMIAAVYDGSHAPDGNVNFTTFSFAKTGEIWPEWQMVMSTGMSLGSGEISTLLGQSEQARGRLMIGDCVVR
ncbi:DUF805 domain-containing protein [Aurantiacibacter flavus]|uniref:DUF805 domain-containing protein n=1 Tax=Aurantiacibacter flavus TaxID=3145232 RepID=A0ABV0CWY4_9SPHN